MSLDDAFKRCPEALYAAALDDTRWSAATSLIEEALDAAGNTLSVVEGATTTCESISPAFSTAATAPTT